MATAIGSTKFCPKCKRNLPLDCFWKQRSRPDGLKVWCKDCVRAGYRSQYATDQSLRERKRSYRKAHPERVHEWTVRWRKRHPDIFADYTRRWRAKNRDKRAQQSARYYARHGAAIRHRNRDWRQRNQSWMRRYAAEYKAANSDLIHTLRRSRRARKRGAAGHHTRTAIRAILKMQRGRCAYCRKRLTPSDMHVDHIEPLSRGGSNWPNNIQVTCGSCNLRKKDKDPIAFAQSLGRLL